MAYTNTTKALSDYPLPDSTHIERQLLSDMATNPDAIGSVDAIVEPGMFTSKDRRELYETLLAMYYADKKIDYSTIYGRVGQKFVTEVINSGVTTGTTPTDTLVHAEALRGIEVRKRAYNAAVSLLNLSVMPGATEEDIFVEAESISNTLQGAKPVKEESTMPEVMNDLCEELQERERLAKAGMSFRVPTGFPSLDSLTFRGWGAGQLIILAARPSVGKTAVMLHMARAAASAKFPTAIFSLEMTKSELGQRMIYSTGIIDPLQVSDCVIDWDRFEIAVSAVASLPITINDSARQIRKIASKIQIMARRGECRVAFIDYLGLVKDAENAKLPLYQQIANITGTLKATAKAAGIPIILLCQLNRASVAEDRPPQLFDLRDSGSIEQDADIVLMLEHAKDSTLNMWLRKNRQYRKEVCINLRPDDTYSQFEEIGMQD